MSSRSPRLEPDPPRPDPHQREHHIIRTLLGHASRAGQDQDAPRVPPGDDCAVLADGTALTVDALVEGVHWDHRLEPADVGWKTVAVSVSDLAAMGARPAWMLLALCTRAPHAWIDAFARGLGEACRRFGVRLLGGDVTTSPGPTAISGTLGGRCVAEPVRRSTARPGDRLWVTGTLGLGAAGWMLDDPPSEALAALRRPDPPLGFGLALAAEGVATAMMDLSDGLASDLPRLCAASEVGARVAPERLPRHPALAFLDDPLPLQVGGGEDYQLLFTARPGAPVEALARREGVAVTEIGEITADREVALVGRRWPAVAFTHDAAEADGPVPAGRRR